MRMSRPSPVTTPESLRAAGVNYDDDACFARVHCLHICPSLKILFIHTRSWIKAEGLNRAWNRCVNISGGTWTIVFRASSALTSLSASQPPFTKRRKCIYPFIHLLTQAFISPFLAPSLTHEHTQFFSKIKHSSLLRANKVNCAIMALTRYMNPWPSACFSCCVCLKWRRCVVILCRAKNQWTLDENTAESFPKWSRHISHGHVFPQAATAPSNAQHSDFEFHSTPSQ